MEKRMLGYLLLSLNMTTFLNALFEICLVRNITLKIIDSKFQELSFVQFSSASLKMKQNEMKLIRKLRGCCSKYLYDFKSPTALQ
jgi:hypothetical protein